MHKERFEELLGLLLDEEISNEQLGELAKLIAEDADCLKELRRQLVTADQLSQYENEQRSAEAFIEGLKTRLGASEDSEKFVEQVMETVEGAGVSAKDKIVDVVNRRKDVVIILDTCNECEPEPTSRLISGLCKFNCSKNSLDIFLS